MQPARKNCLLQLLSEKAGDISGSPVFGGAFPHLRIFQVFVEEPYRRASVASQLIDALIQEGEDNRHITVSARVADDLVESNAFWEHKGFDVNRAIRGGPSSSRIINVRTRYLNTPTLFSSGRSTPRKARDLQLIERTPSTFPTFSLDLNVLLDIVEKRSNATDVGDVIGAAMRNLLRLFAAGSSLRYFRFYPSHEQIGPRFTSAPGSAEVGSCGLEPGQGVQHRLR